MDKHLAPLYRQFAMYDNYRSFPGPKDGLKPVERRVLYTAYLVARNKFVKCARIDGTCTARFHAHGSAYGTLVYLANQGFLLKQGNFGSNIGTQKTEASAMRYTETKLTKYIDDLVFKYIDYVPMVLSETEDDKEPEFLPTMFSLCLLGEDDTQGIGTGFQTRFPCYELEDLKKRLFWLLKKEGPEPIIKPKSSCTILSKDDELKQLLTTGNATLTIQGKMQVDVLNGKVYLKSWAPPDKSFQVLLKKFNEEFLRADVGYLDLSAGEIGTNIVFSVLKQRNRDKILKDFAAKLEKEITSTVKYNMNIVENNTVKLISVDQFLLNCFYQFKNINEIYLNQEIAKLQSVIIEYQNLEKIRPAISEILKETNLTKDNFEEKVSLISSMSGVQIEDIKTLLSKHRIQKLFIVNTDTSQVKSELNTLLMNQQNLDNYILGQYQIFSKPIEGD